MVDRIKLKIMKTIEITLFKFNELSEEAQQKAVEKEQKYAYEDGEVLHYFSEKCKEKAKEAGFFDTEIQYSLSYSQGDGLSFSAGSVDIDRFITEALPAPIKPSIFNALKTVIYKVAITGNTGIHYSYASRKDVSIETDYPQHNYNDYSNIAGLIETIENHIQNVYMDLCRELEKSGYEEIEYQTSEEAARENLISNDYYFTENGEIY